MDIMKPKLIQINGMCFRRLDLPLDANDSDFIIFSDDNQNENKVSIIDQTINETKYMNVLEIIDSDEGQQQSEDKVMFSEELKIAKRFHGLIIGKYGSTKRQIEEQTNTSIKVPLKGDLRGSVVISSSLKSNIKSAKDRITSIVESMRLRSDLTHFVSIPLNHNSIRERFNQFMSEVLNDNECKSKGIDKSLFQLSEKLHLTIAPLLLCDEIEIKTASQILEDFNRNFMKSIINGKEVKLRIEGIDYMNDDPTQVDVIYAKIVDLTENQWLQKIVNELFVRFDESKLMTRSHEFERISDELKVKLHMTLLNTKYRQTSNKYGRDDRHRNDFKPKRQTFDATPLINHFGNYCFGETAIETIDISIIPFDGRGRDGFYRHIYSITL